MSNKQLQEMILKFKKNQKQEPFTTSIRIDGKLHKKINDYLASQGITFSDFLNDYLISVEQDFDKLIENQK